MSHHKNPYQMMNRMRRLVRRLEARDNELKLRPSLVDKAFHQGFCGAVEIVLEEIGPILEDPPNEPESVVKIGGDQ